jgi:DDE superfamily endonuclease
VREEHPGADVEIWATDEHRIGLKPILRRVWAPRGKRPVVTIHPRYQWRYLSGYVHPASGRTEWHLSSGISVELFTRSLAAFAEQAGAGPTREIILVLDRAGWHMSRRVTIPAHLHLVPLPPYTPELQPAERLWSFSNTPLVNVRPTDLDELDTLQLDRWAALQSDPALVATIQSATHYHWWPADYSPIT